MPIEPGQSEIWVAPLPRCPAHGGMHYDAPHCQWVCHGWDGEGCDHVVGDDQLAYERAGTAEVAITEQYPATDVPWPPLPAGYDTGPLPLSREAMQRLLDTLNGHET
jgi:hypothetical protein